MLHPPYSVKLEDSIWKKTTPEPVIQGALPTLAADRQIVLDEERLFSTIRTRKLILQKAIRACTEHSPERINQEEI